MADKIDQLTIGSSSYDIALPVDDVNAMFYTTTSTTANAFEVTIPGIDALVDGMTIHVKFHAATASGATLNVNSLGAKAIYYRTATAVTTHIVANNYVTLVYDATNEHWVMQFNYDANTDAVGYQIRTNASIWANKTGYAMNRYMLFFEVDGGLSGTCTTIKSATNKTPVNFKYIPGGVIKYYSKSGSIAIDTNFDAASLWDQYTINLSYSFNCGSTLTSGKPVYVRMTINSDGTLTPNNTGSPSHPIVQDLPTTDDGFAYVYLGEAYSETNIELYNNHPIYQYKDGKICLYTGLTVPATNVIPATTTTNQVLTSTSTSGTAAWSSNINVSTISASSQSDNPLSISYDNDNAYFLVVDESSNQITMSFDTSASQDVTYHMPSKDGTFAVTSDICNASIAYCDMPASTAAKTAIMPNFTNLSADVRILLRITTTNTATSNVTLNVNSTGAKTIKVEGSTITSSSTAALLTAGDYIAYYDGAYWNLTNITGIFNLINLSSVAGAGTSSSGLLSTKWYSSSGAGGFTLPFNGMRILVKIPTLGTNNTAVTTPTQDTIPGALLSINANNNDYYYPVLDSDGKKITGQFPVDSYKIFVFNSSKVATGYKTAGTQTSITGCWIAEADNKLDAYPVGAIYISNNSTSPASLFGGTWEQIKGRFLFSAGANSANSITTYGDLAANQINLGGTGSTGGEIFHQLGVTEMPSHQHEVIEALDNTNIKLGNYSGSDRRSISNTLNAPSWGNNITTASVGGSLGHNNMPPFYTCYMWKRTA